MKKILYLIIFFSVFIKGFSQSPRLFLADYEHSEFSGDDLNSVSLYSLAYSNWSIRENNSDPSVIIRLSFGEFDSQNSIKENICWGLAYEQLYKKKLNSYINREILAGISFNIFDFTYNENKTFNGSTFNGDSVHALKLYVSWGLEFSFSDRFGAGLRILPQFILFKDTTERGLANDVLNTNLGLAYNFGFTYKF